MKLKGWFGLLQVSFPFPRYSGRALTQVQGGVQLSLMALSLSSHSWGVRGPSRRQGGPAHLEGVAGVALWERLERVGLGRCRNGSLSWKHRKPPSKVRPFDSSPDWCPTYARENLGPQPLGPGHRSTQNRPLLRDRHRRHPVHISGTSSRCALVTHAIKNIRIVCQAEP
jgi:hypothetical protein